MFTKKRIAKGYECGGTLQPVSVWAKPDDSWEILQRCSLCGEIVSAPVSKDDNPIKLLSLATKPLSAPLHEETASFHSLFN